MAKSFLNNSPSIEMTIVGFGQGGSRIADSFARFKDIKDKTVYNCFAFNSNDGDLVELKYIPQENRFSLGLGGFGKNPEKGVKILTENEKAKNSLLDFVINKVGSKSDLNLFCVGLGGGTGTSSTIRAIEEYYEHFRKPVINQLVNETLKKVGKENFVKNQNKYLRDAILEADEKVTKIGVIATLPLRAEGHSVLRQVNEFATKLWKLAKDPLKGIAFVIFVDNQYFYDKFNSLAVNEREDIENFRDFANQEISNLFHELNTGTNGSGAQVSFDEVEFKRILLEGTGSLVINRLTSPISKVQSSGDIIDLFKQSIDEGNVLHDPIKLEIINDNNENELVKIHHFGLFAIVDPKRNVSTSFIDDSLRVPQEHPSVFVQGSVFAGYIQSYNDHAVSVYTFYKADALPERLAKGLVEEYNEYMEKYKKASFAETKIETIESIEDDISLNIDLSDLDISDLLNNDKEDKKQEETTELDFDIDDLDFSNIKI